MSSTKWWMGICKTHSGHKRLGGEASGVASGAAASPRPVPLEGTAGGQKGGGGSCPAAGPGASPDAYEGLGRGPGGLTPPGEGEDGTAQAPAAASLWRSPGRGRRRPWHSQAGDGVGHTHPTAGVSAQHPLPARAGVGGERGGAGGTRRHTRARPGRRSRSRTRPRGSLPAGPA